MNRDNPGNLKPGPSLFPKLLVREDSAAVHDGLAAPSYLLGVMISPL